MKAKFLIILTHLIGLSFNVSSANDDEFISNTYLPSTLSGVIPHSIVFNSINNNLYVYTGQKILVIDDSNNIIDNIVVGNTGYLVGFHSTLSRINKLFFDGTNNNNYIYCANEDDQLLVIDCNNNHNIIYTFESEYDLKSSYIYYNEDVQNLYWIQNNINGNSQSKITSISTIDFTTQYDYYTADSYNFYDLIVCSNGNYISLSSYRIFPGNPPTYDSYIVSLDANDLSWKDTYWIHSYKSTKMIYISEANRLYCHSNNVDGSILHAFSINHNTGQINHLSNYTIDDFPLIDCNSTCHDPVNDYAYFVGWHANNPEDRALIIIDYYETGSGMPIVAEHNPILANQVVYSANNERVYCSGREGYVYKLNGVNIEFSTTYQGVFNGQITTDNDIILTNIGCQTIEYFSQYDLSHSATTGLGENIYSGCINQGENKIYWFGNSGNRTKCNYDNISVHNLNDDSFVNVELDSRIIEQGFHEASNKLLVSTSYWSGNKLYIIDGTNNNIEHEINIDGNAISQIFPRKDGYSFLGGINTLSVIDMYNYTITPIVNGLSNPFYVLDFAELNSGDYVVLVTESVYGCKLLHIAKNSNQIIASYNYALDPVEIKPLVYSKDRNEIYINTYNSLHTISGDSFSLESSIFFNGTVKSFHYSDRSDAIVVIVRVTSGYNLSFIDADSFTILDEVNFSAFTIVMSSVYNPLNNRVYLNILRQNLSSDNEIRLLSFNCETHILESDIYLMQNNVKNYFIFSSLLQLIIDENSNMLYIPNQGIGNISKIGLSNDEIRLRSGITWFSFPRLESQGMSAVDALTERIVPSIPSYGFGNMSHNLVIPASPTNQQTPIGITKDGSGPWVPTGDLSNVDSKKGYILEISPEQERTLELTGERLAPETPFNIYSDVTNWVGYWPTWQQDPLEALTDIMDDLTLIKHQDWACVKDYINNGDGNLVPIWICMEPKPLKYGDMLKLESDADIIGFQWASGSGGDYNDTPQAEYFSFTEEPDYTPIFIELDTTNSNPQEIGAFVNDTCIGACVVSQEDTLVGIQAYFGDLSGEVIFEEYYDTMKSSPKKVISYLVHDPESGIKENRIIFSGERKPYYHISFKESDEKQISAGPILITINPNPCESNCRIEYYIPYQADVLMEIFDLMGKKLSGRVMNNQPIGWYSSELGPELDQGVYIVRVTAGNSYSAEKLMITN